MRVMRIQQTRFLGHILKKACLEKYVLLRNIEGRRGRGRLRMKHSTRKEFQRDVRFADLVEMATERREWCFKVAHVDQDMAHL